MNYVRVTFISASRRSTSRRTARSTATSTASSPPEFNKHTTVDAMEMETFSKLAHNWWDPDGLMRGLRTFNRIRVPFIIDALAITQERPNLLEKKILDVGCGAGVLSEALAECGANVTGIDTTKEVIEIATQHCKTNQELTMKPKYECTTIEEHANAYKNYYDGVVASEVIEHVSNKELFVKACVEALKPGGRIFFTTPSKTTLSLFVNIWFAENVMNLPPKGTHQYEKFMTPSELNYLLQINGCNVEVIRGYVFNMVTNTWSWIPTKGLFFAMQAVKKSQWTCFSCTTNFNSNYIL